MYLKRLEVQGFKTFASRTVLEFRPGITAIVGPNGSGKSNLADAVRWVLGEQSYTALRCKRTEELLFSGGGRRPPAGLAEVALTIDNSDRVLPLAFDEVTITRRANRAGENEYFLNRARVRLRDIQEATEPLGGSYTIINQGLVDLALTLRPEERRRLFEDAAEVGGLELRKTEAERRLREMHTNVQRVVDVLGELEPRLRSLKRQAQQARQHRDLNTELQQLLQRYHRIQWHTAHAAQLVAEQHAAQLAAELEQTRAAQASVAAEVRELRQSLRTRREQLGALHQQRSALYTRAEAIQRDLAVSAERLAALTQRAEELEQARTELETRQTEARHALAETTAALEVAEADLIAQREYLAACETEVAALCATRRALQHDLAIAQETALHTATQAAAQRSRAEQLAARRAELTHEQAALAAALEQTATHLAAARQRVETAQAAVADATKSQTAARQQEAAAREHLARLQAERSATDEERAAARRTLADLEAHLDTLNRLARSYSGTFAGVKAAMQWAERTGRHGFTLVATIIHTPPELETAVEVALGSRLQNIVVETWQDAEDAIAELKRSNLGRATFLPLDTLRTGRDDPRRPEYTADSSADPYAAPVLGVAADLVRYDAHYAIVARHLLGRVLLVRDLLIARQEVRRLPGGWMIVTLGGEQVQSSGAVTGGSRTKETGTLRRERELRELPPQVQQVRDTLAAIEARQRALDEQLTAATQAVRTAEAHQKEATQHLRDQQAALDQAMREVARAIHERDWQEERAAAIQRDLEALTEQETQLAAQQATVEQQVAAAQQQLADLRTRQEHEIQADRAVQEQVNQVRAAVATAEGQVKASHTLVATHQQALERLEQQQHATTQRLLALTNERQALADTRANAEATHHDLLQAIDALRAEIDPAEAALHTLEVHQAEREQHEAHTTATLLEQEATFQRVTLEAQRAHDRLEHVLERARADGVAIGPAVSAEHTAADPAAQIMPTDAAAPAAMDMPELTARIAQLQERMARLGTINPLALEEYEQTAERHRFLQAQLADIEQAEGNLRELITELENAMHTRFTTTFGAVAAEFERRFTRLFGGGSARLQFVNSGTGDAANDDGAADEAHTPRARSVGIEIVVRPPGKRQQNLSLLSGGERALTASALLFAILTVNPSPFCILDEVDAALDESNVGRFREALVELTRQTQFILITHNRGTIEAADTLYGVTMGDDGASRLLSLEVTVER